MRFDDRLKTVMTQPVADAHDRTVRWRQLVDLLSRPHEEIDPALLDAALSMVRSGLRSVARPIRAATARSIAGRASEPQLVAIFAADKLEVAAPLLSSAQLNEDGWAMVSKAASKEVAGFIRTIRGEASAPQVAEQPEVAAPPAEEEHEPSIAELVARIERLKAKRETAEIVEKFETPELQSAEIPTGGPMLFRWECDASGQIAWVDGAPRGALIGRSLPGEEGADRQLVRAFADRLPFDGAQMTIPTPALDGDWRLSGIPAFSPVDGRFLGYRGIARRGLEEEGELAPTIEPRPVLTNEAETLRETIHEIKTPLNAIIGFAEIIDGQYLGPAHRSYRHRAAEIVSQARILLAAIEDLDFAARVQTGSSGPQVPTDLGQILPPLIEELAAQALAHGVELRVTPISDQHPCALDQDLAARLLRRLLGAVIDAASPAETIKVDVHEEKGRCLVSVTRPASTAHLSERQMLDPSFLSEGEQEGARLGLGFALRLVRGLVRLAGGSLKMTADHIVLTMRAAKTS